MEREIKFRAWDKEFHKMLVNEILYRASGKLYSVSNDQGGTYFFADDIELMQYTELKDKNGVEIYEGDIVKHNDDEFLYQIIFRRGEFILYNSEMVIVPNSLYRQLSDNDIEIIGNIYENKELLE